MEISKYLVIQEWMLSLGLRGSELLAYALIYGFCQDNQSEFHGSVDYVAHWCNITRQQATTVLKNLTKRGVISKEQIAGAPSHYQINDPIGVMTISGDVKLLDMSNNFTGGVKKLDKGCKETLHNNIEDKIDKTYNSPHTLRAREDADLIAYGDHVRMTAAEHGKLVARFGAQDTDRLCEILDGYLDNPKRTNRYRSHYRAILGWPVTRLQEEKLTQQRMENAKQQAQRQHGYQQGPPPGNYARLADANRRLKELEEKYK